MVLTAQHIFPAPSPRVANPQQLTSALGVRSCRKCGSRGVKASYVRLLF